MKFSLSLTLSFFAISFFGQIPTAGLLGYYPFCGSANDYSGNNRHGSVIGAVLSTDRFGQPNSAYSFNGVSDYILLAPVNDFINRDVYSYSFWLKATSSAVSVPFSIGSNDPYCQSLSFNTTSVSAGSYMNGTSANQAYVFSNPLSNSSAWIHVAVSRDSTSLKLYVNGVLQPATSAANTYSQPASYGVAIPYQAVFGGRSNMTYFFQGQLDDLRFYATVLSQNDVTALYNEPGPAIALAGGVTCAGDSFTLVPSGSTSYSFVNTTSVVAPNTTTTYTVKGLESTGCIVEAKATITVIPSPVISVLGKTSICKGETTSLVASGAATYNWGTVTGSTVVLTPASSTSLNVIGTAANGCTASTQVLVTVFMCTDLNKKENGNFQVFPNPTSDYLNVVLNESDSGTFILINITGAVCLDTLLHAGLNRIDVSKMVSQGLYTAIIESKESHTQIRKVVIVN